MAGRCVTAQAVPAVVLIRSALSWPRPCNWTGGNVTDNSLELLAAPIHTLDR